MMKFLFTIFTCTSLLFAQNDTCKYQLLYQGKMIYVSAEKALYETPQTKHFFIHYQIKNISTSNIGIYTDNYFGLFYPNQWGIEKQPERMSIDEMRIIPAVLTDSVIQFMENKYKKNQLTLIQPDEVFDYYRDFNASNKKDLKVKQGEFLFVSMDGQLLITNGSVTEHAHFDDLSLLDRSSLFFSYPLIWKKIPANSKIFYED